MSEQPEALRLADELERWLLVSAKTRLEASAELRRLHEVNQELLEALKQALATLEYMYSAAHDVAEPAITAIKQALADHIGDVNKMVEQPAQQPHCDDCGGFDPKCPLAQPAQQQEPVNKYCCHLCFSKSGQMFLDRMILCPECGNKRCPKATYHELPCTNSNEPGQPGSIYTSPPASKPWVGLTDEERDEIYNTHEPYADLKAVEAKLKEKNNG